MQSVRKLWVSDDGGYWSPSQGYRYFSGSWEAFDVGSEYLDRYSAWGSGGAAESWEYAASVYKNETGVMPLRGLYYEAQATNSRAIHARLDEAAGIMAHSAAHWKTMANPLVQSMHRASSEFWSHPVTQGVAYTLGAVVTGGMGLVGSAASAVPRAAAGARFASGSVDAISQATINYATNGGDMVSAVTNINITSVALSTLNPTASFSRIAFNSTAASALEFRLDGNSSNIFTEKGLGQIASSVSISLGTFGVFQGLGALGRAGVTNTRGIGSSIFNHPNLGIGSSVYTQNAYLWAGSKFFSTSGSFSGFGATISTNLFGN